MTAAINLANPGLANRMKTYLSCLTCYDEVRTLKDSDAFLFSSVKVATSEEKKELPCFDNWRFHIEEDEQQHLKDYAHIDLLYEETPEYFKEKYFNATKRLKINPEILGYVKDFDRENDLSNVIGLHIRSWYCSRNLWHNNKLFEDAIDQLDSDRKIFLCGDNDDVLEQFQNKYGDRIITHAQERYNHPHQAESGHTDSFQTNADALCDLLILSKCAIIVGTYASTFTEVAWWLGECKPKVIVPDPPNVPQEFKDRIFKRL